MIVMFLRRMLRKVDAPALHVAKGASGQQSEHGCAAQRSFESDCCAGPIQMGHQLGASMAMFS